MPSCRRLPRVVQLLRVTVNARRRGHARSSTEPASKKQKPEDDESERDADDQSPDRLRETSKPVKHGLLRCPGAGSRRRSVRGGRPDRLWIADITYVPTRPGFLYLAVVLDAWSRRIVGWAMASNLRTELVVGALAMALAKRRPIAVIHHSDQYTSVAFGRRCREAGVRPSIGSVGDAYHSPMCESFFATLECEALARQRLENRVRATSAVVSAVGLSLVKRLVELHGGVVHGSSDGPGHGSVFTIRRPRAARLDPTA